MGLIGMPVGDPRPPRLPLPAAAVPKLRSTLEALGLIRARAA